MSEDIEIESENDGDGGNSKNANAEAARLRRDRNKWRAEVETLRDQLSEIERERDALKIAVESAPGEAGKEVERLRGELRIRDHRAAFDRLAAGKIKDNAYDAAWKLSEYTPESDEIDEAKLSETITSLVEANPFLGVPTPEESSQGDPGSPSPSRLAGKSGPPSPLTGFGRGPAPKSDNTGNQPTVFRLA